MNITITYNGNERNFDLDCVFLCKEKDYGNKYYLSITNNLGFNECLDIRYDTTFDINKKEESKIASINTKLNNRNTKC